MKKATSRRPSEKFSAKRADSDSEHHRQSVLRSAWLQQIDLDGLLNGLFDELPGLLLILRDELGRIMFLNRATRERYGIQDESTVLGRSCYELSQDLRPGQPTPTNIPFPVDVPVTAGRPELWFDQHKSPNWFRVARLPLCAPDGTGQGSLLLLHPVDGAAFDATGLGDISQAVEHIHRHYAKPVTVAELAELSLVSVRQLERKFLAAFAVTPKQYLLKVRISVACRSLIRGQGSIADIAAECGFYDQSAFTRYFHQLMGVPPNHFRRQHIGGQPRK